MNGPRQAHCDLLWEKHHLVAGGDQLVMNLMNFCGTESVYFPEGLGTLHHKIVDDPCNEAVNPKSREVIWAWDHLVALSTSIQ